MKVSVLAAAATLFLSAPLATSASHGGGFGGGGGFHGGGGFGGGGGGFHGGGRSFGGMRGGGHDLGNHGVGRHGDHDFRHDHFHDRDDLFFFEPDFDLAFGFYDPWDFGYAGYYAYDVADGYDTTALPPPPPATASAAPPATETSQCGAWRWEPAIQKYRWLSEAC